MLPVEPWSGLTLVARIAEGNRNEVWRARRAGKSFSVRQSRRSGPSLQWELELLEFLAGTGFVVPSVVPTDDGRLHDGGVVVQRWIEGRPPSEASDWLAVAVELQRLHALTSDYQQRPGCCAVTDLQRHQESVDADLRDMPAIERGLVESVFVEFADAPTAVVHGDPDASNIRMTPDGQVGLLDWDESRVDVTWHDLSNLGVAVLEPSEHQRALSLSDAWEAANGWTAEPDYARVRLADLKQRRSS